MRLKSIHPGITIEKGKDATGFELLIPENTIPEKSPPTKAQVKLIREGIDPDEMRKKELRRRG